MKTTVDVADNLFHRAKARAKERNITLRTLIEEALAGALDEDSPWHEQTLSCLTTLANSSEPWAIPWPCIHHGVRLLWSADRDFSAFPALRCRNPLAE